MFNFEHPFFLITWRRYAVTAFCTVWALAELAYNNVFWAIIVGAVAVACIWGLILNFDEDVVRKRLAEKENSGKP